MPDDRKVELKAEIGHVLFLDIVGYSTLLINEQSELLRDLNEIVRSTEEFREGNAAGSLLRLPTGDGMALVFRGNPEAPARCALQISQALKTHPELPVRMGIHSGPVSRVTDVDERANVAGAGVNIAQRVMDCGDAGHILLSRRAADDLASYRHWQPLLHDLGEVTVKHGVTIGLVNLYNDEVGNAVVPEKLREAGKDTAPAKGWRSSPGKWIGLAAALVLGALLWLFLQSHRFPSPVAGVKRIAILPFKPLVSSNSDEVLQMGMADSLITKLSNSREMVVTSLPTVRKYAGLDQDSLAAGHDLQVDSVLEGNLQRSGDHIRVSARLLRVSDGSSLWAGTFDEKFTDVFAVQDAISKKVADALALRLSGDEQKQFAKRYTANVEAYQLYLTGRFHWNQLSPPEIAKSVGYFEQAIALDPNYALAHFGLAEAYRALSITGEIRPSDILPKAKAAAEKAIALDPALAEPHVTLALVKMWFDWDWAGAENEAQRAIHLNPNLALAHSAYSQILTARRADAEAIAEGRRARELDPVSPIVNAIEGMSLFFAGQYDEAGTRFEKTLELNPNFWIGHLFAGHVLLAKNELNAAIAEFTKAHDLARGNTQPDSMLVWCAARSGDPARGRAILDQMLAESTRRYVPPFNLAVAYLGLDDRENALDHLEKACAERDTLLIFLRVDRRWDPVRSDPRFAAVMQRIGPDGP